MTKHFERHVPRAPVRDADRAPATRESARSSNPRPTGPLIPVHEIAGLAPHERVAELRLRVESGEYGKPGTVEQVARAIQARGL